MDQAEQLSIAGLQARDRIAHRQAVISGQRYGTLGHESKSARESRAPHVPTLGISHDSASNSEEPHACSSLIRGKRVAAAPHNGHCLGQRVGRIVNTNAPFEVSKEGFAVLVENCFNVIHRRPRSLSGT